MVEPKLLLEARPSRWTFFWHYVFFWLLFPLFIVIWKRAGTVLRIYEDRVVLERGVLSKSIKEFFVSDVRALDVRQSFLQRVFGVGDVMIGTAGTASYEAVARGLPDPRGIRDLIIQQRHRVRRSPD